MFVVLPGFLGLPEEWLQGERGVFLKKRSWVVDFWSTASVAPVSQGLEQLGRWVNETAQKQFLGLQGVSKPLPLFLLGYSFGGRVALAAFEQAPSFWSGVVLLSTHLGLEGRVQCAQRMASDEEWAEQFTTACGKGWAELLHRWETQAIFQGGMALAEERVTQEEHYQKMQLGAALRHCSLGASPLLNDRVMALEKIRQRTQTPFLWLSGSKDRKIRHLFSVVKKGAPFLLQHWIEIQRAGHRIHRDQWDLTQSAIEAFCVTSSYSSFS